MRSGARLKNWFQRGVESLRGAALSLRSRWIPCLVAAVLLTAAVLKAHGLLTDPLAAADIAFFWLEVALVEIELACGLALVFGIRPQLTRLGAMVLFACFIGVALSKALSGASSCACFGNAVDLHPWFAVAMDLVVLAALWRWRAPFRGFLPRVEETKWNESAGQARFILCRATAVALLLAFPVTLVAFYQPGRYPHLEVSATTIDLGTLKRGERRTFSLHIRNPHDKPVTVQIVEASCPCLKAHGLPWHLLPQETNLVALEVDMAKEGDSPTRLGIELRARTPQNDLALVGRVQLSVASLP